MLKVLCVTRRYNNELVVKYVYWKYCMHIIKLHKNSTPYFPRLQRLCGWSPHQYRYYLIGQHNKTGSTQIYSVLLILLFALLVCGTLMSCTYNANIAQGWIFSVVWPASLRKRIVTFAYFYKKKQVAFLCHYQKKGIVWVIG